MNISFVYHAAKHDNNNIKCDSQSHVLSKGRFFLGNLRVLGYVLKLRHLYDLSIHHATLYATLKRFFFFAICRLITVNLYFKMGIQRIYDCFIHFTFFIQVNCEKFFKITCNAIK